jgi:hypothetical protein
MAWWTVWREKASSRGWAIAASVVNLLQWTPFMFSAPRCCWYFAHWQSIWTHSVIGIAGLVVFLPRWTEHPVGSGGATGTGERLLRFFQVSFLVCVLLCASGVRYFPHRASVGTMTLGQWIWALAGLCLGAMGLLMPWLLARAESHQPPNVLGETQLVRWGTGHLVRLACSAGVCTCAFALYLAGGPIWLTGNLLGAGLILLITWSPGASTTQAPLS